MNTWLEEAESRSRPAKDTGIAREKIQKKREAIRQNYEANIDTYNSFIRELRELVDRVNNLPIEHRREFGKLKMNAKESKLDNELYYITSSRSVRKRAFINLSAIFNKAHFKNIRVGYFTVSRHPGIADVELKENLLLKVRLKTNGRNERAMRLKKKDWGRKKELFRINMGSLNKELAMEIIDWVSFRKEMEEMSFSTEKHA